MNERRLARYERRARLLDLFLALAGLAVLWPVMAAVAVVVRAAMGRPVLFRQERAGRDGQPFTMLKFRTMRTAPEGAPWDPATDAERLTAVGSFLRSWSLDELPQLWNVVRGEMSIVGPRPLPVVYVERYTAEQRERLRVRPGITGPAQVGGRNETSWEDRMELDIAFVRRASLRLYLRILLATIGAALHRRGVNHGDGRTMTEFRGER